MLLWRLEATWPTEGYPQLTCVWRRGKSDVVGTVELMQPALNKFGVVHVQGAEEFVKPENELTDPPFSIEGKTDDGRILKAHKAMVDSLDDDTFALLLGRDLMELSEE